MENKNRDEEWMEYLRERPQEAKKLIREAQRRSIADIKKEYGDVIKTYDKTKAVLDGIIGGLVILQKISKKKAERMNVARNFNWLTKNARKNGTASVMNFISRMERNTILMNWKLPPVKHHTKN